MNKYKPVRYEQLVSVAKRVLLTVQVAKIDGLKNEGNDIKVKGMSSRLYLHGGTAPRELNKLLTWHEMHKMRKTWMDKLFPYFEPFIPGLTRKAMWEAIKERRKVYRNDREKRSERRERNNNEMRDPNLEFIDCTGRPHPDKWPRVRSTKNYERLFPMQGHKYVEWILSIPHHRRQQLENCAELEHHQRWGSLSIDFEGAKLRFKDESHDREHFAVGDQYYCWGWGVDFELVVSKGRIFIESGVGNLEYVRHRNYITQKALEKFNGKVEEESTVVGGSD